MWRIENDALFMGDGDLTQTKPFNLPNRVDTLFTTNNKEGDTDKLMDLLKIEMQVSEDQKYCAIIYPTMDIVNIYEKYWWSTDDPKNKEPGQGHGKWHGKYISTLRRNKYYASHVKKFIFSFVQQEGTNDTLILFNKKHGELAVLKPTGEEVFSDHNNDKFMSKLTWINKSYFALEVWFWHPFYAVMLYNVKDLLSGPGYKAKVRVDEEGDDGNVDKIISIKDDKIIYYGFEFTPEDFEANFEKIEEETQHRCYLRDLETYGDQQFGTLQGIKWEAVRLNDGCWSATVHIDLEGLSVRDKEILEAISHEEQGPKFTCNTKYDYMPILEAGNERCNKDTIYRDFQYVLEKITDMIEHIMFDHGAVDKNKLACE
jgi:hypothetical protein